MNARILIVDDELEIREMLSRHFRFQSMDVETAGNGKEALEIMAEKKIDVVISDIMMPEMNGIDLLRRIQSEYPMTHAIMMTGYVTQENILSCMRHGADNCVFKPLDENLAELEQCVVDALKALNRWNEKLHELKGMKPARGDAS
jgi:YesN/AraC family two-component response regulator